MSDTKFWSKVKKTDACWEYAGAKNRCGYGWIGRRGTQMHAHRWSWIIANGEIPEGLSVLHKCDNPACVNPDHLYLGTHKNNMIDRATRRRCKTQKLSRDDVLEIRRMRKTGVTCQEVADKFGISNGHASCVARGIHYGND